MQVVVRTTFDAPINYICKNGEAESAVTKPWIRTSYDPRPKGKEKVNITDNLVDFALGHG